jgi:hypothetical protein
MSLTIAKNMVPYFLDVEMARRMGRLGDERTVFRVGDQLPPAVFCTTGGRCCMNPTPIRVPVLGTQDDALFCPPDLFFRAAVRVGGAPLFEPPPFACPCTDGLLIIYTLQRRVNDDVVDIHGGFIRMTKKEIEEENDVCQYWRHAQKPSDMATLLKRLGFDDSRQVYVN